MKKKFSRRKFIQQKSNVGLGAAAGINFQMFDISSKAPEKPVKLGGQPAFKNSWLEWPIWNPDTDEPKLLEVMRSGVRSRNKVGCIISD